MELAAPMEETAAVEESPGPLEEEAPAKWVFYSFSHGLLLVFFLTISKSPSQSRKPSLLLYHRRLTLMI